MNQRTDEQYQRNLLTKLEISDTNVDKASKLEYNVDGCSCMGCKCFKSAWTVVLAPVSVAAGMAAYAADVVL